MRVALPLPADGNPLGLLRRPGLESCDSCWAVRRFWAVAAITAGQRRFLCTDRSRILAGCSLSSRGASARVVSACCRFRRGVGLP